MGKIGTNSNDSDFPQPRSAGTSRCPILCRIGKKAIQARGVFYVALAGGSTPKVIYQALAQMPLPHSLLPLKLPIYRSCPRDRLKVINGSPS
ncbi:MAG: hypothetical protein HC792_06725 [Acaryochloridaceae cyanobacterium CSU_5_19]|nr:hypothetical protein [Acaryochloridaceae cyanobacterium CSU_5_19]